MTVSLHAIPSGVRFLNEAEGIRCYVLQNGLRVLVYPVKSSPSVTMSLTCLTGSGAETSGKTGAAHLLEHMIFRGSAGFPDPDRTFAAAGIDSNGGTAEDFTQFVLVSPPETDAVRTSLSWLRSISADAFLRGEDLVAEKHVVLSEYAQWENDAGNALFDRMRSAVFGRFSSSRPAIGEKADIERLTAEDLRNFYRTWYRPDNLVLLIAGKCAESDALSLAAELFSNVPLPDSPLQKIYPSLPKADGACSAELSRPGKLKGIAAGYRTPSALSSDFGAFLVAAHLLLGKVTRTLKSAGDPRYEFRIRRDAGMAIAGVTSADLSVPGLQLKMLVFFIERMCLKHSMKDSAILSWKQGVAEDFESTLLNPEDFSESIAEYLALGDWRLFFAVRDRAAAASPEDIRKAARRYFTKNNRVTGLLLPEEHPESVLTFEVPEASEVLKGISFKTASDDVTAADTSPEGLVKGMIRYREGKVNVVLFPFANRERKMFFQTRLDYGKSADERRILLRDMSDLMIAGGTAELNEDAIDERMEKLQMEGSPLSFAAGRDHASEAISFAAELIRESSFSKSVYKQRQAEEIQALEARETDLLSSVFDAIGKHFSPYPDKDPRYFLSGSERADILVRLSRNDVRKWFQKEMTTAAGEITVTGDFDPETVREAIADFVSSKADGTPEKRVRLLPDERRKILPVRLETDRPDEEGAVLALRANLAAHRDDEMAPALWAADRILCGDASLTSRIAVRLRQKEGLSYTLTSTLWLYDPEDDESSFWLMHAAVPPEKLLYAEKCVREELHRILKDGITAEELESAKRSLIRERDTVLANGDALAEKLLDFAKDDRAPEKDRLFEERLRNLTSEDVNRAIRMIVRPDDISWFLFGDAKKCGFKNLNNK